MCKGYVEMKMKMGQTPVHVFIIAQSHMNVSLNNKCCQHVLSENCLHINMYFYNYIYFSWLAVNQRSANSWTCAHLQSYRSYWYRFIVFNNYICIEVFIYFFIHVSCRSYSINGSLMLSMQKTCAYFRRLDFLLSPYNFSLYLKLFLFVHALLSNYLFPLLSHDIPETQTPMIPNDSVISSRQFLTMEGIILFFRSCQRPYVRKFQSIVYISISTTTEQSTLELLTWKVLTFLWATYGRSTTRSCISICISRVMTLV